MNCYQFRDQISAYIEKELTLPQVTLFETHLSGCSYCRDSYDGVESVTRTMRESERVTVSDRFDAALKNRLDRLAKQSTRRPNRFIHEGTVLGLEPKYAVMSVAALAAIVILSVSLFPGGESPALNTPVPLSTRQPLSNPVPGSGSDASPSSLPDQLAGDPRDDTTGTQREPGTTRQPYEDRIQLVKDQP